MADSKITALTALTAADPANDMIPIVDVSDTPPASGNTKRISINNILACSPSATLASATITGDLTVDTSTLKVDSTGNAVGIGSASPAANTLTIGSSRFILCSESQSKFGDSGIVNGGAADGNTQIQYFGGKALIFSEGANNTQMTLNSTGLGVGAASPAYKLDIRSGATSIAAQFASTTTTAYTPSAYTGDKARLLLTGGNATGATIGLALSAGGSNENYFGVVQEAGGAGAFVWQGYNGSAYVERMRLDSAGNLILQSSATPATLTVNGQLTVNATSNTNLRFSYRGSDGVTRTANLTLA